MKDADFNFQCIPNIKRLCYETVSPEHYGQVCLNIKGDQDSLLISFTKTPPKTTTANHTG